MVTIEIGGGTLAYDTAGPRTSRAEPGPSLVFVHGIGADATLWHDWRAVLAPRFASIALDLPGHGGSYRPGAAFDWSFADLAGAVHAVADTAGARERILIGESIGGTIALAAAAGRPEVKAVITCSTAHLGGSLNHVATWRKLIAAEGLAGWSADMLDKRFAPGQVDAGRRAWFDRAQRASDAETVLKLADLLVGLDLSDRLAEIACPVLLIHPDESPFIPLDIPVALKRGLPAAELMVVPGARHGIACSHGRVAAEAALAFLARHGLA